MAANFWDNSDADNDANNANNWSLGNVPTGTDVATFDNTSDTNCTLSGHISCAGIDVTAAYDGVLDFATYNLTTTGNMTFASPGTVHCRTGTLACGGNFDNSGQTTWNRDTSTVEMTGSGGTIKSGSTKDLHHLTITDDTTVDATTATWLDIQGTLTVASAKTLTCNQTTISNTLATLTGHLSIATGKSVYLSGSAAINGNVTGLGSLRLYSCTLSAFGGTITCTSLYVTRSCTLIAGTYAPSSATIFSQDHATVNQTATLSGAITFGSHVQIDNGEAGRTYTFDLSANPTITIEGNFSFGIDTTGDIQFSASSNAITVQGDMVSVVSGGGEVLVDSQAITLTGTSAQDIDSPGSSWGLWTINKASGTVTFSDDLTATGIDCDSSGDIDLGANAFVLGASGFVFDHAGALDYGTGTIGITGGPCDTVDVGGTVTTGTAVFTFNGACTWLSNNADEFYHVVIPTGATVTATAGSQGIEVDGFLDITGTLSLSSTVRTSANCDTTLNDGASIEGTGTFLLLNAASSHGIITKHANSAVTCENLTISVPAPGCVLAAGTYRPTRVKVKHTSSAAGRGLALNGSYTFSGLELETTSTGEITLDLATHNATVLVEDDFTIDINSTGNAVLDASSNALTVEGDIVDEITGGGTFTADSQPLTLSNTSAQDIDPCGGTWGLVTINKASGTVTFSGDLTATGIDCDSSGDIDLGANAFVLGASGFVFDHAGALDLGSGTIGITGGPWDTVDVGGTLTDGTAVVTLNGACNLLTNGTPSSFYHLVVPTGATATITSGSGSYVKIAAFLDITGTVSIASGRYLRPLYQCDVSLNDGASITGAGNFYQADAAATHGIIVKHVNSSVTCGTFWMNNPATGSVLAAGVYQPTTWVKFSVSGSGNRELVLSASAYTFSVLELETTSTGSLTLDLDTNNPTVTVEGDLTVDIDSTGSVILGASSNPLTVEGDIIDEITGGGTFTADSQDLTLSNTSAQDIDPCGGTWGAVLISKDSGTATLSGNLIATGITFDTATGATFDAATFDVTLGAGGLDCTGGAAATLDLGTGTWALTDGDWDSEDIGTMTEGTSTVVCGGTLSMLTKLNERFYNLTIPAGATVTQGSAAVRNRQFVDGVFDVAGSYTITRWDDLWYTVNGAEFKLRSTGSINGSGYGWVEMQGPGGMTVFEAGGTLSCAQLYVAAEDTAGVLAPGTFGCRVVLANGNGTHTLRLSAGTYAFDGGLELYNTYETTKSLTIDCATNNPTITVAGDLILDIDSTAGIILDASSNPLTVEGDIVDEISGGGTFTADSQDLTLSNTSAQDIDPCGGTWGAVIVSKTSGTATLSGALTCASISVESGSSLDLNDQNLTTTSDQTYASTGTISCGSGTLECAGNFSLVGQTTWVGGTSTVLMTGTAKNIIGHESRLLYSLTIDGTITVDSATATSVRIDDGVLTVNDGKQLTLSDNVSITNGTINNAGTIDIASSKKLYLYYTGTHTNTGTISGAGSVWTSGEAVVVVNTSGVWSVANTLFRQGGTISGGTYGGTFLCENDSGSRTLTLGTAGSQTLTFTGNVTFDADAAGTYTIDCATNNPDIVFQGDVTVQETAGTLNWSAGSGTITLSGTSAQAVDFNGETIDAVVVDKSSETATLTGNLVCASLTVQSGSSLDLNDQNLTTTSHQTYASTGTVSCGSGTLECAGNFSNVGQTTWTQETSTVKLTGAGTTLTGHSGNDLHNLTIASTVTLDAATSTRADINGLLLIDGGTFTLEETCRVIGDFQSTGTVDGTDLLQVWGGASITSIGTIACGEMRLLRSHDANIAAGTYNAGLVTIRNNEPGTSNTFRFASGTYVFTGNVVFANADVGETYTLDLATNNPDIEIQGDVTNTQTGTLTWQPGNGTITLNGTNAQGIDFDFGTIDAVVINKTAGTVTLSGALDAASLTLTDGDLDPNGQTITTTGNCDWASGFTFVPGSSDTMNGCSWVVGGNFTADGQDLNATSTWTLSVTGTAVASGIGNVEYSDASGGTEIDASAGPWVDGLNNSNWGFGASGVVFFPFFVRIYENSLIAR